MCSYIVYSTDSNCNREIKPENAQKMRCYIPKEYFEILKKGGENYLDSCIQSYIKKVNVIESKLGLQFIHYKDLYDSPHYSVKYNEFCEIRSIAKQSNIPMEGFCTRANHFQPKTHDVMVANLFKNRHIVSPSLIH